MSTAKDKELFRLNFTDHDVADTLKNVTPPRGIKISGPQFLIEASASSGGVFLQFIITYSKDVSAGLVAAWLYDCISKGKKKSGDINHHNITFSQSSIRRLIQKQAADQKARDKQWAKEQKKPRPKLL